MKKFIQICIVVFVCLMAATSAGFMKNPQQSDNIMADEMSLQKTSTPVASTIAELKNVTFERRPIEPGVLFLFGTGIIGIIGIHRLKFQ